MLKEIICEKFAQTKISFHSGLNVIAGDDNASNSIGKSSSLLVVEFAFGGNTYARQNDILENVGHHSIAFCHTFGDEEFYFRRNTATPSTISVCNEKYEVVEEKPIEWLYDFFLKNYRISHKSLSFREFVGLFSRIYGKENLNENKPIDIRSGESGSNSITRILKIFDEYAKLEEQKRIKESANNDFKVFKSAQGLNLVNSTLNKKDRSECEKDIQSLDCSIANLTAQLSGMAINLDSQKLEAITIQKQQQQLLDSLLARQKQKLKRLQRSLITSKESCTVDTSKIAAFFPNIDIAKVDSINEFHGRITSILKTKIVQEIKDVQKLIEQYNKEIDTVTKEISSIVNCKNPISLSVDNLIRLRQQREKLVKIISDTDLYNQYSGNKKIAEESLKTMVLQAVTTIQQKLNNELESLSEVVSPHKNPPQFSLRESAYTFFIPNDTGAGSKYKSTILTDLGFMNLTDLPFVIHDTILFKNVEDDTMENILVEYTSYKNKQVFIAFDHINSYSKKAQNLLRENTVLDIIPGGKELFGKSWNKK